MFIDPAVNPAALQRSAMFATMNIRDRLHFAPAERGESLEFAFYRHFVPTGRGSCFAQEERGQAHLPNPEIMALEHVNPAVLHPSGLPFC
jgi:hypothetical protein